ncbi:LAGLIDADG-like domain-containing protein [Bacillus sp. 71mf]|nr:LAGLIDADG-like domain-containing protein [Bacillus sp. 71mf]SFS88231.1 LAGLIDADG-like domain-containing protein [Bacillus sp. 103mf]
MIKLYLDGSSTSDIANLANVTSRYVRMVLADNNVEMRARGSWKRKYDINEDYFKTWSNNMAYILGFFIADGVIAKNCHTVSISQKEKEILEDIKKEIKSNQPLCKNKNTDVYMLNLNSKIMKNDLIDIHGITPCKSYDVQFPYVPEEFLHHFIRGYFDGDGHVNPKKYFASFVSGSHLFMNSLKEVLIAQNLKPKFIDKEKQYRIYLSGKKDIQHFAEWIYKDKELFLRRKREIFQQKK